MDKPTRGRVRKVDLLPDSIRKPLLEMLREKRLTQVQIREEINRLIREAGLPEEQQLSNVQPQNHKTEQTSPNNISL